jgi:hypothetical protein
MTSLSGDVQIIPQILRWMFPLAIVSMSTAVCDAQLG